MFVNADGRQNLNDLEQRSRNDLHLLQYNIFVCLLYIKYTEQKSQHFYTTTLSKILVELYNKIFL